MNNKYLLIFLLVSCLLAGQSRAQNPIRGFFSNVFGRVTNRRASTSTLETTTMTTTVKETIIFHVTVTVTTTILSEPITVVVTAIQQPDSTTTVDELLLLDTTINPIYDEELNNIPTEPAPIILPDEPETPAPTPSIQVTTTTSDVVVVPTSSSTTLTKVTTTRSTVPLKIVTRNASRYFALRQPKDEIDVNDLKPSEILSVENSVDPVKRSIDIESSLMASNQQPKSSN